MKSTIIDYARCSRGIFSLGIWILTFLVNGSSQEFYNLDFSQVCNDSSTRLCHWDLSWGGKGAVQPDQVNLEPCLLITGENEHSVGFAEQTSHINTGTDLKIITVTALIRTDSIKGKGAGLNLGLYDKDDQLIGTKDMGGYYSLDWKKNNVEWVRIAISIVCPPMTWKVKIGAILYGQGKVWFKDYEVQVTAVDSREPSDLAKAYVTAACDTIFKNSLVRDSIDIETLEVTALKIAGDAKNYDDCHLAINYLLESLRVYGDHHSFFMTPGEVENWENEGSEIIKIEYPEYDLIDSCAYLGIPPFHGGNPDQSRSYADSLQSAIRTLDAEEIKGWIVDLRSNTGGNMAPMVAGLGPLFSSKKLGSLINVEGVADAWNYSDGLYYWDSDAGWAVTNPVETLHKGPVAVLIDSQTGSSGEAVAISFIGNDKTKFFGQATFGLTTGNGEFRLLDGAQIFLASTIMADRKGQHYHGPIRPDFEVNISHSQTEDVVLRKAIEWIKSQR